MTVKLRIAEGLDLPIDAITQKFAFLARSGAGKTYAAGKLAEELLGAGAQVVVLDPVGVWWGLRVAADGRSPGIAIPVFGGEHGDIPLEPGGGQLVADLVVDKGTSVVLDLSPFRKGQRKDFVTAFAEQLFHRKKSHRSPLHIILEEAQAFVPQRVIKGEERMLGAWEDICKLGRNYGIGFSLISQRPQAVNKDVLNQAEVLVVLQTSGPQERKAIEGWIDEKGIQPATSHMRDLPGLPIGTACVWSPQWLKLLDRFRIAKKRTYDASATPTWQTHGPDAGRQWRPTNRTLAPVELDEIRVAMAQVVERATANDPAALRKRIAELERQLRAATDAKVKAASPVRVPYVPPELLAEIRRLDHQVGQLVAQQTQAHELTEGVAAALCRVVALVEETRKNQPLPIEPAKANGGANQVVKRSGMPAPAVQVQRADDAHRLPKGARDMLAALARLHPRPLSRTQVATLAGLAPTGGTFAKYLSILRTEALVQVEGDTITLTEAGSRSARSATTDDGIDIKALWMSKLPKGARDMLTILLESRATMTRHQLGELAAIEPSGGTFAKYLSILRTNGLADVDQHGVRASSTFDLGG